MEDLNQLYQQIILDYNKYPNNFEDIKSYTHMSVGHNTTCGDKYTVKVVLEGETIKSIYYFGEGCAISKASGSIMISLFEGKTIDECKKIFDDFQKLINTDIALDIEKHGKLAVLAGVRNFPSRVKCAVLVWHTFLSAVGVKKD